MLTRKHFKALADALAGSVPVKPSHSEPMPDYWRYRDQWIADVSAIADVCERSNPRFNRDKFRAACGIAVLPPTNLTPVTGE